MTLPVYPLKTQHVEHLRGTLRELTDNVALKADIDRLCDMAHAASPHSQVSPWPPRAQVDGTEPEDPLLGTTELPAGWRMLTNRPPTYRRRDGYTVRFDNPASWGVRAPGEQVPFRRGFPDSVAAMAWVDAEYPLDSAHGEPE